MSRQLYFWVSVALVVALAVPGIAWGGDSSLVGWWRFDDGSGTVARDSSGNGNDAALMGDATWATGNIRGAVVIDGNGDYLEAAASDSLNVTGSAITLTAWVYFEDVGVVQIILAKAFNNTAHLSPYFSYGLHILSNGRGRCWLSLTSNTQSYAMAPEGTVKAQRWHHMAGVYDGSQIRLYLDGEIVATSSATGNLNPYPDGLLRMGDNGGLTEPMDGKLDDIRIYSRVLSEAELADVMLGKGPASELAADPVPTDEAVDVPRDTVLGWTAGEFAQTHDVYFGTTPDDVNTAGRTNPLDVLVSQNQADTSYNPATVLEFGQTYYWRVDEVNGTADHTIFKGDLWRFTVEPLSYAIVPIAATASSSNDATMGPEKTIDGSGLDVLDQHGISANAMWLSGPGDADVWIQYEFVQAVKLDQMWVWNSNQMLEFLIGFGAKDVTVETSLDGVTWTALADVPEFAQATGISGYAHGTVVNFGGVLAQYVRLTINSGWGTLGQYGLSEVRFLYIPMQARDPQPADGETEVSPAALMSWRAGREAATHEVYLGTDEQALALVDVATQSSSAPDDLELGTTYYWRIDEVNDSADPGLWEGDIWSFSVQEFLVVDDFESYNDDDDLIYETWLDGWANETGSTVGYFEAPFAEQEVVHGGRQSMPLFYDNASGGVSEADLTLSELRDWTTAGITTLTVHFRGDADNTGGQLYVKINGVQVVYDAVADPLTKLLWQPWNIDLASLGTNLSNVTTLTVGVEGGGEGVVYIDDIHLYRSAPGVAGSADPGSEGQLLEYTFDGDATDRSGNGYDGTLIGDARIQNGVLVLDGIRDAVAVPRIGGDDAFHSAFTYSMWIRPTDDLTSLEYSGGLNSDGWTDGSVHFKFHYGSLNVGINGLSGGDLEGTTAAVTGAWNHMALTVSEAQIAIYLNGQQEDVRTLDAPLTNLVVGEASLGAWSNGGTLQREMPGEMDNVLIYDRGLSEDEVRFLAGL